jgi:tRNA-dihydrouridine synthase
VSIPVVANGDLQTYDDARAMLEASGADAVMVARAARGRPWFPGQIAKFLETGVRPADPRLLFSATARSSRRVAALRFRARHSGGTEDIGWGLKPGRLVRTFHCGLSAWASGH